MADQKKRISELPESSSTKGLYTLGVNARNESVKVPLGELLDGITPKVNQAVSTANEAKTEAGKATTSANNANTTANEAKSLANDASDRAETASELSQKAMSFSRLGSTARFDGFVDRANIMLASYGGSKQGEVVFVRYNKVFAYCVDGTYYNNWANDPSADLFFPESSRYAINKDKTYICGDKLYIWDEEANDLVIAGSDPTEVENSISNAVKPRCFINANVLLNSNDNLTLESVIALLKSNGYANSEWMAEGMVLTFRTADGWKNYRYTANDYAHIFVGDFEEFGSGNATVGNCYNVTNEQPISGYYDLENAINATYSKGFGAVGMQITFAIAKNSWKTYQYVGSDVESSNFKNTQLWLDLAGISAGAETLINVDALCGACTSASFYTLEYAISAITKLQAESGITYAKSGLVITYKTAENTWETKQFKGEASDFGESSLWHDFGGAGGSKVETKDEPQEDGSDAFSTGGAYNYVPANLHVDTETEGVIKISMINAKGETVGDEQQFAVGTGSGESSGTIVSIIPESAPMYAKAGGSVILKAAILSITKQGGQEISNMIERVELYDRDTNQLLETYRLNQSSSADNESFDFSFDLSSYFVQASSRKFKLIAYDDSDHSGSRNINVTAVDVTIKSEQTLNYTSSTIVNVGGSTKTLPMYRFANNASDKGILCTVEIQIKGAWKTLGTATISDTYSHSISINPNNCAGEVLSHGAYPIRIHGVDIASGVVGNYLHTAIMVIDSESSSPIIVNRWYSEKETAEVKQYETISMDFAAYNPASQSIDITVRDMGTHNAEKQKVVAYRNKTYTYTQRVQGYEIDGTNNIVLYLTSQSVSSQIASFNIKGTLLDIESVSAQLMFDMDMSSRSNSDADKTISDNGYTLSVKGSNYSTNGFVKDSYGTEQYGTENDNGIMALRIAENVSASLNYMPFNQASIEANGLAVQFRIKVKHIADDNTRLISCIQNGIGFYVTGKEVVFTTDNGATVAHTIMYPIKEDSLTDVAIVIEPTSQAPYANIGVAKMYFDGELIGACYYDKGSFSRHATPITFDGTQGDLYLYNIRAWETYYSFEQSFDNYLLKLSDTDTMITEYDFNKGVMASQSAEGKPAINRPQASALYALGMPYFVLCKNADTGDTEDQYPPYLESLDGDKKTKRYFDVYAYFPDRPWQDFKAINVPTTNQGTTSSMRPIKNIKMKFKGCEITLLHDRSEFSSAEDLAKYDECASNAAQSRMQPMENSIPTNIITVKVDYSESGGANNGASCQLYNELQRALGKDYMTPAQNAYKGKYTLNTSIDSVPIAFFRTDMYSSDATSPSYGYFHAKGNWNHDKGDAVVFGFEKVDGYNLGCLNYGDFIELIAARDQSLDDYLSSIDKSSWDTTQIYVLSEFCGDKHKVFRYQSDKWIETTGTMTYESGRWRISGDVVNPVENYELRAYDALDWFQGVDGIDDMLAPDSKGKPIWLTYFESRYPDNDELNAAYEDGRKVPYQLYKWLRWCQDCNHNLDSSHGNITLDGKTVAGTAANRLLKFKHELHNVANVHSMICYHVFTDYIAAVDQRSKNMMVGFYLDTDGVVRMYLNHLYDGDTILGSDNDCGLTIDAELDPNNDTEGKYQGHDSVLFTQLAKSDYIWIADYSSDDDKSDSTKTVTVASICNKMRTTTLASGLRPFSKDGIEKYWITDRLSKWAKLVSSFDGIRKYIEASKADSNYFYALHGLSIQRLRVFVDTRFRYRDGFYQCGDIYSSVVSMRCTGKNMSVKITAAKDGFFGIGVDQTMSMRQSVYLKAGESATLNSGNTNLASGVMLYIYGADRIGELDIRNATPKQSGWDISQLVLIKKLIIGGSSYSPATKTGEELSNLNLGQLPFLEELDVRNFPLTAIDSTYCPRLTTVYAVGSKLQTFTPAETSPISKLTLPDTMTSLSFVNLPNLTYPNGGLTIAGFSNVRRLQLSGCGNIDTFKLLSDVVNGGASIAEISIPNIDVTADTTILTALKNTGAKGIGSDLEDACDGLSGKWIFTKLIDDNEMKALQYYFPSLYIYNAQYTMVVFDDTIDDPKNITNLDNGTSGEKFTASGHVARIRKKLIPVKGKLNTSTGIWEGEKISESNYQQLPDGSSFDFKDSLGDGFDVMMRCPALWYKGINDFKNQKKYIAWSSLDNEPLSTANKIIRKTLKDIIYKTNSAVMINAVTLGESTLTSDGVLADTPNYNAYIIDVSGMKQIRYPGMNNANIGGVFINENGIIIKTFNMAISSSMFDFVEGDYIFTDVPAGAKSFVFASSVKNNSLEAISVDSSEIEAIEPDWVHNDEWLGGVYHASVDGLTQLRSISGANIRVGTGTSTTSSEWKYDEEGKPTNTPTGAMNYTFKDFQNLASRRGKGYQLFDYEMSKLMAILYFSLVGNRDAQLVCGYGRGAGGTTGYSDALGNSDSTRGQLNGNKCLGFESFFGCTWEIMDNVAINITTYAAALKDKMTEVSSYPINHIWHIFDPITKTERTVQGLNVSGYCIGRVKHGRFCDVIASKVTSDNSVWAANYTDCQWYSASRCRFVGRSSYYANAYGGLVYAYASYGSAYSNTNVGSRLAFRGKIKITNE
jgi:hypothetical protein